MNPTQVALCGTITGICEPESAGETVPFYPSIWIEISPHTTIKAMITPEYAERTLEEFMDTYQFIQNEQILITAELYKYPMNGEIITAKTMQHI